MNDLVLDENNELIIKGTNYKFLTKKQILDDSKLSIENSFLQKVDPIKNKQEKSIENNEDKPNSSKSFKEEKSENENNKSNVNEDEEDYEMKDNESPIKEDIN